MLNFSRGADSLPVRQPVTSFKPERKHLGVGSLDELKQCDGMQ